MGEHELKDDINFNKHYNHGIEIRIFDHISDQKQLKELLEFLVRLGDFILNIDNITIIDKIKNPIYDKIWNDLMVNIMIEGKDYVLKQSHKKLFENIFCVKFDSIYVKEFYMEMSNYLKLLYANTGNFSKFALKDY